MSQRGSRQLDYRGQHQLKRDEARVNRDQIRTVGERRRRDMTDVGAFHDGHPRIVAQSQDQLSIAHVQRDYPFRAAPQQDIGKPAAGRSDVEREPAIDGNPEAVEGGQQFVSSAAGIFVPDPNHFDARIFVHSQVRFAGRLRIDPHATGQDQPLRILPALRQATPHQFRIEPRPHR